MHRVSPRGGSIDVDRAAQTPEAVQVRRLFGRQWGVAKR